MIHSVSILILTCDLLFLFCLSCFVSYTCFPEVTGLLCFVAVLSFLLTTYLVLFWFFLPHGLSGFVFFCHSSFLTVHFVLFIYFPLNFLFSSQDPGIVSVTSMFFFSLSAFQSVCICWCFSLLFFRLHVNNPVHFLYPRSKMNFIWRFLSHATLSTLHVCIISGTKRCR